MLLYLYCVIFNNFFTIPVVNENAKLKFALAIPTGALITLANNAIAMIPLVSDKAIKDLSK